MNLKTHINPTLFVALVVLLALSGCAAPTQMVTIPTATPVPAPTRTPWWATENVPYPLGSTGFHLVGGSDEQARQRIMDLGAGDDLSALEDIYKSELIRTGKNSANYKFEAMVWESGGKVYWDSVVKDAEGHYLGMKLTKGAESGQIVRAFGLTRYLLDYTANDDFFDFFTLQNPTEFPNAKQQMIWDETGWHVVGLFTQGGNLLGWFNSDKGASGEWEYQDGAIEGKITDLYKVMSAEEMKARDLYGYGMEINAEVEGIPTKVFFVQTDQLVNKFKEFGYSPLYLNPTMGEISDMDSAERIAKAVRIADYEGYLQDKNLTESDYTFEKYIEDLKSGLDRSYIIYCLNTKITVDPSKPHEFVIGYGMESQYKQMFNFGPTLSIYAQDNSDGSLRIVYTNIFFDKSYNDLLSLSKDRRIAGVAGLYNAAFSQNLAYLSFSELAQQGKTIDGDMYYIRTNMENKLYGSPMFIELNNLLGDQMKEFSKNNNAFWIDTINN